VLDFVFKPDKLLPMKGFGRAFSGCKPPMVRSLEPE
jgi:hypothetical protein